METVKYKINAMPSAIDFFGLDYIKSTIIPTIVKQAFKTENINTFYVNSVSALDDYFYHEYAELQKLTRYIKAQYDTILDKFIKTGEIVYPKAYITAVNRAKRRRKQLMTKYPILLEIDRGVKDNAKIMSEMNLVGQIGTGIDHMIKMKKIEQLLISMKNSRRSQSVRKIGYLENEESFNVCDDKINILANAKMLESKINYTPNGFKAKLGRVTVNPVYHAVKICDVPTNCCVAISVSHPNGDLLEEYSILETVARQSKSKNGVDIICKGGDKDGIVELADPMAKKGYLNDIKIGKTSIIDLEKSVF